MDAIDMERETDLHCSAARLCPEDGRVLDALLDHIRADDHDNKRSWPATALNYSDAERATRMTRLLGLIERCPVEQPPDDLVRSTLDRITQAKQSEMFAQQIQTLSMTTPNRFRLNDLLAVAAVILIGLSLAIPVLTQSQGDARRLACMSNLGMTGRAVAAYENDHAGMLPRRKTVAGTPWYMVGQPQASADAPVRSNSAHYFILMRNGYLAPQFLACPDNIQPPPRLIPTRWIGPTPTPSPTVTPTSTCPVHYAQSRHPICPYSRTKTPCSSSENDSNSINPARKTR